MGEVIVLCPSPDFNDPAVLNLVSSIYRGRFARRLHALGIDREDAYQDVLLRLLIKSRAPGSCWTPSRGGLSTWIYVATKSVVAHIIDAHIRSERRNGLPSDHSDVALQDPVIRSRGRLKVSGEGRMAA